MPYSQTESIAIIQPVLGKVLAQVLLSLLRAIEIYYNLSHRSDSEEVANGSLNMLNHQLRKRYSC